MATRDTQKLIVDTAIELFNQHGSGKVSANRIADTCGLSRGHLHYHFKKKEEIVNAIYDRISAEMRQSNGDDLKSPTVHHMLEMLDRYLGLIWRYRFFFREMMALLEADEHLKLRFGRDRRERTQVMVKFFNALIDNRVLLGPRNQTTLTNLVKASWIVSDNWINYLSVDHPAVYPGCVDEGYELMLDLFRAYLSPATLVVLGEGAAGKPGASIRCAGQPSPFFRA